MARVANPCWSCSSRSSSTLEAYPTQPPRDSPDSTSSLSLGEEDVGVVPALRIQEVRHHVTVVTPGEVLMRSIAHHGDVVPHVAPSDDRVEIRNRQHTGEALVAHPVVGE